MIILIGILFIFLVLLELCFLLRKREWRKVGTNPILFFLLAFLLFCGGFFYSLRDRFFVVQSRVLVFTLDSRMDQESMLRTKEVLKEVSKDASCSFGISSESGQWLAPISEDRLFFLLQLGQLHAIVSNDTSSFYPVRPDFSKETLWVVFSPFELKSPPDERMLVFQINPSGMWTMTYKNKKMDIEPSGVAKQVQAYVREKDESFSYSLIEKEMYVLLFGLGFVLLWHYRRAFPWVGVLVLFLSPLEASVAYQKPFVTCFDIAALSSVCNEQEIAEDYVSSQYLLDVFEQHRAVYAYNLALIEARFGNINGALSWVRSGTSLLEKQPVVSSFLRDLYSTAILRGDLSKRSNLLDLLQHTESNDLSEAALLVSPGSPLLDPGIEDGVMMVTTPMIQFLPQNWKESIVMNMGEKDVESSLITRFVESQKSSWDTMAWIASIGFREARLYDLLRAIGPCQKKMAGWLQELLLEYARTSKADSRIVNPNLVALMEKVYSQEGTLCQKWDRCQYMIGVLRPLSESPWIRALANLKGVSSKTGALSYVLEAFSSQKCQESCDFDQEVARYLDSFFLNVALPLSQREWDSIIDSLSSEGMSHALWLFLQKSVVALEKKSDLSLEHLVDTAMMVCDSSRRYVQKLPEEELYRLILSLSRSVSLKLHDQVQTIQEQQLIEKLVVLYKNSSSLVDLLDQTYDVLGELQYIFQQKSIAMVPEQVPLEASSQELFIPKEDAIGLLLQLEQDERDLEKRAE